MSDLDSIVFGKYDAGSAIHVRYVFLDIVRFSYGRPIEAQTAVISRLNVLVAKVVKNRIQSECDYIYLPTGDGVCIAILNAELAYDLPIEIAVDILSSISNLNEKEDDETRRFYVRIGINENVDNLVVDINNRPNIVGAGINEAQRIMDIGDAGQIFLGRASHEMLRHRERFSNAFFAFSNVKVKHDLKIEVFQFIEENLGLVTTPPTHLEAPLIEKAY